MAQLFINAIIASSGYCLVAIGFVLLLRTAGFFNFAHGSVFASGAYFTFIAQRYFGLAALTSAVAGVLLASLLGCLIEVIVFRPLRSSKHSALVSMMASIGVYTALQNVLSVAFGDETRRLESVIMSQRFDLGLAGMTTAQAGIVFASMLISLVTMAALRATRLGLKVRAVADSGELALTVGVNRNRIVLVTASFASAIGGLAGVLMAFDVHMTPTMGMRPLMMAIVAAVIGGSASIPGLMLASLLLALAQQIATWFLPAQWQGCVAFLVLLRQACETRKTAAGRSPVGGRALWQCELALMQLTGIGSVIPW